MLLLPFITFRVSSLFAQEPHHAIELHLQVGTFDPLVDAPQVAPPMQAAESGTQTYLVQFKGPSTEAWKADVTGAGAQLYGYVPDYSLIARMDDAALAQVRAFPFVRWVGPYHPAYRLSPELSAAHTAAGANLLVDVELLPGIDLDRVAARVNQLGGAVRERAANQFASSLRVSIPGARIADLAALDGVLWLEPSQEMVLLNDLGGGGIMRVEAVRQSLGLYGRGQIVGVADTGLDTGQKTNLHTDLRGRLIQGFCLGRTSPCDWSDPNGHGTHVAGSVLGNGAASGSNPSTHSYAGSFAGAAPEAQLVFQSIEGPSGTLSGIPLDHGDLMRQGYRQGARIHTNSWGGRTCANPPSCTQFGYGGYETSSVNVDRVAWEQKDMLILFAAGNDGTDANANGVVDPDSMMQPGTAKNALTVGASENNRAAGGYNPAGPCSSWGDCWPDKYPASPISGDLPSDNPNGMAAFSGRGPTDDGRIKPEVVAPGTNILSLNSHHPNAGAGAWGPYDEDYVYMGGTSMATPLV
ncbi:MAG TPA: S8 family serine peptidase, partial [Ardenticatenaceae bacterium]|nr:S8 family serine peptidase [Ardenticatenaceae bacterium]